MSDIVLDDSEQITVLCNNLKVQGHDFLLDSPERRRPGGSSFRRAVVHDQNDGLTINFASDYPGGVLLNGVTEIHPQRLAPGAGVSAQPTLVVRGGISYEADVPTGDVGQGAIEGETHTITINLDEILSAYQAEIVKLTARVAALEARLP